MTNSAPLTERRYVALFILITSLFFLWAFGVNPNDILIPRFKNAFTLSDFQSSFIQVAFFSGYCLAALPAVFAGYRGSCTAMEHECIFIRSREILSIGVGVSGILAGTDSAILQGVAYSAPRLGFHWRHEAICT
jgi:hypothetical protein